MADIANEFDLKGDQGERHRAALQSQIHQYFNGWERELSVSMPYRRLLRNRDLLFEAGNGIFSKWDLELLAHDAPTSRTPFRFSDLAALLYLKLLLDGTDSQSYRHIVIDEAQDITPLHLKVLYRYSRDGSMTILGDLFQGIYMHHGVHAWEEFQDAVENVAFSRENISQSYRSTQEIIKYANAMLRRTGVSETELADPIERYGAAPMQHPFDTMDALAASLPDIIQDAQSKGWESIAIVCKSLANCNRLFSALQTAEMPEYSFIDSRNVAYTGGVVLLPAYLTGF